MRISSIRARVLYLATVYALILVGTVTLATYFFVARGMENSAHSASGHLSTLAAGELAHQVGIAEAAAARKGLSGDASIADARETLVDSLPDAMASGSIVGGSFALYEDSGDLKPRLLWSSGQQAIVSQEAGRLKTLRTGQAVSATIGTKGLLTGMFTSAGLGVYSVHVPVEIPGASGAVFDVIYRPLEQEALLDSARAPMVLVATVGIIAAVIMMEIIMSWVLSLVGNVRKAADAIDEGDLDVHLPEEGNHEIADLAHSLNHVIERLRRRAESQTRFVADASHELATPVAGIRGYVNILRDWGAEDPAMRDEAVAAIDRESKRMARLCSNLLSMIRDEEVAPRRAARYDLNAASREVLATAATRYMDKHLEFIGPKDAPLWVAGDVDRFGEALGIIVDNAAKYTCEGSVSVTTTKRRDKVVVEVTDTGVGIPPQDMPNVFDRFYRSDASRSKDTGGFGLGLAIVKGIIERAGGSINVRSAVGIGTTFHIELPRNQSKE